MAATVMRSRHKKEPCVCCGKLTAFQRDVRGPRGALLRWEPCCPTPCGEEKLAAK